MIFNEYDALSESVYDFIKPNSFTSQLKKLLHNNTDKITVFTQIQITAFFEGANHMGLPHQTRVYLQTEDVNSPADLVDARILIYNSLVPRGTGNGSHHNGSRRNQLPPEWLPPDRFPPKLPGNLRTS